MMSEIRIKDILPIPADGGIFTAMEEIVPEGTSLPWADSNITSIQLDIMFYTRYAGRIVSPLGEYWYDGTHEYDQASLEELASLLYSYNVQNWDRLWAVFVSEYNPIHNYAMTEESEDGIVDDFGHVNTRGDNLTDTNTGTVTIAPNLTDTRTDNLTETLTPEVVTTTANSVSGFNSATPVASDQQVVTPDGDNTKTNTGTETTTHTGTHTQTNNLSETHIGSVTDTESGQNERTITHTMSRSGNIGVTTTAQMIGQEIELWKWKFFDSVMCDCARLITLPIY